MDPIVFEILRHRLTTIVDEAAANLANASGSPSVAQSNDCNVALLTPSGEGVIMGKAMASHAMSCMQTARYVREHYQENPGIGEGDMFLTNHPYIGTPHQTCAVLVTPVFHGGHLVAWAGAGNHMGDVGGSVPGQVTIGARSIWDEPVPMPPIRIVEGGTLRKDLEDEFLTRSRTRVQNAVDLKAMIGAANTITTRLHEMLGRYGEQQVTTAMQELVTSAEAKLRTIIGEIPDGRWTSRSYLDYYDEGLEIYECALTVIKEAEELTLDFSGSSAQAPAVINATAVATEGFVFRALLAMFGFAVAHCPAAIQRVVRISTEPGTIVDCTWPAGVSKGTTSATQAVMQVTTSCMSQMLMTSERYRERAMAVSRGHLMILDGFGDDQYGEPFAAVFQDCAQAAGSGALSGSDGLDTGGIMEPLVGIPNVENAELRFPILYLYRRQELDTGGPGMFRGGVGLTMAITPHDVSEISDIMVHTHGIVAPSAQGLSGGCPGTANRIVIKRETNISSVLRAGVIPSQPNEIVGTNEVPPSFDHTHLEAGDVLICVGSGGGGYGDPLDRDPVAVEQDVRNLVVSSEMAREHYGVEVTPEGSVDQRATEALRESLRAARGKGEESAGTVRAGAAEPEAAGSSRQINEYLESVVDDAGDEQVRCRCGALLGPPETLLQRLITRAKPCTADLPYLDSLSDPRRFVLIERSCPACLTLVGTEVTMKAGDEEGDVSDADSAQSYGLRDSGASEPPAP